MKKIIDYLHLKDVGFFELMFAMYPIILGYQYGGIPMQLVMLLIMDIIAILTQV